MFRQFVKQATKACFRNFSISNAKNHKVSIIGGAGGIGQPLSLLLKLNPRITHLSVHDIAPVTTGVVVDLSHIDTASFIEDFVGPEELGPAIKGSDIVICVAGLARKPGMTRDDLFSINAGVAQDLAERVAENCPDTLLAVITNPVNSLVPVVAEVLKKAGCYNPRKVFGVTTLDVVRSRKFLSTFLCCDPSCVDIPVIGGHAGITILPILSQCKPQYRGTEEQNIALTKRIQDAGTEVVEAKGGMGSATQSMAYAASVFVESLLRGLDGEQGVVEYSYVQSDLTAAPYFASLVLLGKCGIEKLLDLPPFACHEQQMVDAAVCELQKNIQKGIDFVNASSSKC